MYSQCLLLAHKDGDLCVMYKFFLMNVGLDSELLKNNVFRSLHFVIHYLFNIFNRP